MKLQSKLVAILLSAVLVASFVPIAAIATEPADTETLPEVTTEPAEESTATEPATEQPNATEQANTLARVNANESSSEGPTSTYSAQDAPSFYVYGSTSGPDGNGKFNFNGGSAVIKLGESPLTASNVNVQVGNTITITPTANHNGDVANIDIAGTKASVQSGATYSYTIPSNGNYFQMDITFGPDGGGQPGGNLTAKLKYSHEGDALDISLNGGAMLDPQQLGSDTFTEVQYNGAADDTMVTFEFSVLFIQYIEDIKINNTSYADQLPKTNQQLADAFRNQHTFVTLQIPKATSDEYTISTKTSPATPSTCGVGNFLWSYDPADAGNDDYLDHGKLEFVNLNYNGQDYSASDLQRGTARDWDEGDTEGGAVFPAGSTLTVRLTPDYGYQLTEFTINGGTFGTGEVTSTYSFTVPAGNFHLGAHFTAVSDVVRSTSDTVTGGSVALANGLINTGSALLSVQSVTPSAADTSAFTQAADTGFQVSSYLDLTLDQVVYKGTNSADNAWVTPLGATEEFTEPVTVALQLAEGTVAAGDTVEVLHERHDGTIEIIAAAYDDSTRMLTFQTDSFSEYALATKEGKSIEKSALPNTGDPLSAVPLTLLAIGAGTVALYAWRRQVD